MPIVTPRTDLNPLTERDGQSIGVHKATGIERSNIEQGSEDGGSGSTPERSAGSVPRPDAFANLLAVRDPLQVSEASTDATPIQDLEHMIRYTDSVSDTESSLGSL